LFKVVPLCELQLKDIRKEDILENGNMRKCNSYRGGGGYDQFPYIAEKRLQIKTTEQLVVQLYGCNLKCPYCYVTKEGIFGKYIEYKSKELINILNKNNLNVFHLMGGAPALYYEKWIDIIRELQDNQLFHSDFLLSEKLYKNEIIKEIAQKNCLYAVNIKGTDKENYETNTNTKYNEKKIFKNLEILIKNDINFYITFTAANNNTYESYVNLLIKNFGINILEDSFRIELIKYEALK